MCGRLSTRVKETDGRKYERTKEHGELQRCSWDDCVDRRERAEEEETEKEETDKEKEGKGTLQTYATELEEFIGHWFGRLVLVNKIV